MLGFGDERIPTFVFKKYYSCSVAPDRVPRTVTKLVDSVAQYYVLSIGNMAQAPCEWLPVVRKAPSPLSEGVIPSRYIGIRSVLYDADAFA